MIKFGVLIDPNWLNRLMSIYCIWPWLMPKYISYKKGNLLAFYLVYEYNSIHIEFELKLNQIYFFQTQSDIVRNNLNKRINPNVVCCINERTQGWWHVCFDNILLLLYIKLHCCSALSICCTRNTPHPTLPYVEKKWNVLLVVF